MEIPVKDQLDLFPRNSPAVAGRVSVTAMRERPVLSPTGEIMNRESIVSVEELPNMIVYAGRAILASLMTRDGATVPDKIWYFAIGKGETDPPEPPSPEDIALKDEVQEFEFDQVAVVSPVSRIFTTVIDQNVATGDWNEIALKTQQHVLFARRTYRTQNKPPDVFLIFRWVITF